MENKDFLKQIEETEVKADKIISDARTKRREDEDNARQKAQEIIEKANLDANKYFKDQISKANDEGEKMLSHETERANNVANKLEDAAKDKRQDAVKKVTEGIVKFSVNR